MSVEPLDAPSKTYRIGHLSREFGVTARTLRFYEELGLLAPDRRGSARLYSRKDRARLILILQGRAVGIPLAEVGHLLDLHEREGRAALHADALSIFRRQLRLLEARREAAEKGIAILQSAIAQLSDPDEAGVPERREATPAAAGERLSGRGPQWWGKGRAPQADLVQRRDGPSHAAEVPLAAQLIRDLEDGVVRG
ncbi:MerR family transcriptional regulator [Phenylobacterium sp.]|uniref:MerR family transcriptional regulator n=1 Tax=Phenylobacterium sp. TaxID=1871053 RepID=UPI002FC78F29